jgi:hypothetical protein
VISKKSANLPFAGGERKGEPDAIRLRLPGPSENVQK